MNLYFHFPFCRRKCAYCALHSRAGVSAEARRAYVRGLVESLAREMRRAGGAAARASTVYFGGGTPALCELEPLFAALAPHIDSSTEFTVELHPLDVTPDLTARLADGGVNRVSLGVEALDDAILAAMGRGYTFDAAERAFSIVRGRFENAGIDLISGYPGEPTDLSPRLARLENWGLAHCSAYSLILEPGTLLFRRVERGEVRLPDDDAAMDRLAALAGFLESIGLERYEISNYALPGRECRHNLATWRGEDYIGIGEGAAGRRGLERTMGGEIVERVDPERDAKERALFRLRTREGLDASRFPQWRAKLDRFAAEHLLSGEYPVYILTARGMEVCDSILAELV